jgi:hypothetical protein
LIIRIDDLFQRVDRLGPFDLGDQECPASGGAQQLARHVHVFLVLRKGHGQVFRVDRDRGLHVVHVLGRQRRRRQAAAHAVDAFVVRQSAADLDARDDRGAADRLDAQANQPVVEQQDDAGSDVVGQLLVIESDAFLVAQVPRGVERELLAGLEHDLAGSELADADLRALQVGHDRDLATQRSRRIAHHARAPLVVRRGAMRKIQPYDVDAGSEHSRQHVGGAAGRTERGDYFGRALHRGSRLKRIVVAAVQRAARCSRIATAGSVLPSRNSRNAPPPVEM